MDGATATQPLTLAPCQETQWEFMCALAPEDPGRSLHVVIDNRYLWGPLDPDALHEAFAEVTGRHDGLRLVFDSTGPDARVRVRCRMDPPVEHLDLGALSEERQNAAIDDLLFHENRRAFDLRAGPLWHAWVVRLGPAKHLLSVCLSHIIADGWSPRVFVADLLAAYGARLGLASPPAGQPLSFAEIHAAQARRLEPRPERLRYWRDRLVPLPPDPEMLALLRTSPDADPMARAALDFLLPPATADEVRRVAWRARSTPFIALLAAYHVFLCLGSGREQSVINGAVLGRSTDQEKRTIFQFAIDPYIHTELPPGCSLLGIVQAMTVSMAEAVENAVSYTSIARAANPDFDTSRPWPAANFCDGDFIDAAFYDGRQTVSGLELKQVFIPGQPPAGFRPEMAVSRLADRCAWAWGCRSAPAIAIGPRRNGGLVRYNGQIYPEAAVRELLDRYLWVVEALVWRPEMEVGTLRRQYSSRFAG